MCLFTRLWPDVARLQNDGNEDRVTLPTPPHTEAERHARTLLERAIVRARLVLLWEKMWPPFASMAAVVAVFLALSFLGLWETVPGYARIVGVLLFVAALAIAGRRLFPFRLPTRAECLTRLDTRSALSHRPATALADQLATRPEDPVSAALWRAHLARARNVVHRLTPGAPRSDMPKRDPYALRVLAGLALVATFLMAPGDHLARLKAAFDWQNLSTPAPYRLDAWVDPPRYTGRPPIVLPGLRPDAPPPSAEAMDTVLDVPEGSVLVVRGAGLDPSSARISGDIVLAVPEAGENAPPPGEGELRFSITGEGSLSLRAPNRQTLTWHFRALADLPPSISFLKPPASGQRNALALAYRVEDDYGVKEATARFAPLPPAPPLFPRPGSSAPQAPEKPLVDAPDFALSLPPGGRTGSVQMNKDLTAHPWAGAKVRMSLHARDEAEQDAQSEPHELTLPERRFTQPVSRALIDERRRLALDPASRRRLVAVLTALTTAPDQFTPKAGEYLGLRTALARAKLARNNEDLRALVDYLWDVAVQIEDGRLSDAERALQAAQEALREALENGADDAEIARLTEDLRQAMARLLSQMAQQAQHNDGTDRPLDQNTRVVTPQELQRMLEQMENLARSGNREAARQMLDQLQAMMENLRSGNPQAGNQQGQQQGELGKMIQEQQKLRDRTWRQQRRNGEAEQGQNPGEGESFEQLQQEQQGLRERLDKMREALRRQQQVPTGDEGEKGREAMGQAGQAFDNATEAMQDAEDALGEGDGRGALEAEGRALQALRRGAQALAQGQQGQQGGGSASGQTDPMGRPPGGQQGMGDDFTVKVPDEMDAQRARRVLEELRRRLEDAGRPRQELDYLERLLEGQ